MKRYRAIAKIVCIWAAAAVLILSCALNAAGAEKALFLKDTFPDGFKLKEPVRFYNQGDLYEYIDGQAVFYISYGFKRLEHGVYVSGKKEYTVDVYELASRLSAFGAYRQQRDESSGELKVGVEGSTIEYLTTFYKGSHYIEIIPAGSESEDVPTMKKLASHVAAAIHGETELPPEVGLFPQKDLIAGSERYVDENLLSYSVMGRGLTAHYNQGGDTELRVFLALPADHLAVLLSDGVDRRDRGDDLLAAEGAGDEHPQGDLAVAGQVHAAPAAFQVRLDQQHIIQGILGQEDPQPLRVFQHASRRCGLHQSGCAGAGPLDRLQ